MSIHKDREEILKGSVESRVFTIRKDAMELARIISKWCDPEMTDIMRNLVPRMADSNNAACASGGLSEEEIWIRKISGGQVGLFTYCVNHSLDWMEESMARAFANRGDEGREACRLMCKLVLRMDAHDSH